VYIIMPVRAFRNVKRFCDISHSTVLNAGSTHGICSSTAHNKSLFSSLMNSCSTLCCVSTVWLTALIHWQLCAIVSLFEWQSIQVVSHSDALTALCNSFSGWVTNLFKWWVKHF